MNDLFIDCSAGLAGNMFLGSLLDLGVPIEILEKELLNLGIRNKVDIQIERGHSFNQNGLKVLVESLETKNSPKLWKEIREFILKSKLDNNIIKRVINTFQILAEAEASVHGTEIENVHFHELGSLETLVDIVGVFAVLNYLKIKNIYSTFPPSGAGNVNTQHGQLSVPVPVVLELSRKHNIKLFGTNDCNLGELTTPTGLALLIECSNYFKRPDYFSIKSIGVGLGLKKLNQPNLLRTCLLENCNKINTTNFIKSSIIIQEAWIDDASPEDLSLLMIKLRENGAIEVVSEQIQMKKGRNAVSIKVLTNESNAEKLRNIWFANGTTIGLRERLDDRWVLPRRKGTCKTSLGRIIVKQVRRPDGRNTIKPEFDELLRLSSKTGFNVEDIRKEVMINSDKFIPEEDWMF